MHTQLQRTTTNYYTQLQTPTTRNYNNLQQLLLYLARAHYDADDLAAARRALQSAVRLAPSDARLWFDLALVLQEAAVRAFNRKRPEGDPTKVGAGVCCGCKRL